ncbi:TPA: TonB-dependent receptor [Stenotrophomonas maltophilia]|nr:TonB-dependent receptor [Stenotrophomonas maltophilia]
MALTAWGGTGAVHAQTSEAPRAYAIEAGTLEAALNQLSRQSQVQIVFRPDMVAGKRAGAVSGQLTWRQALDRLLLGSGLEYRQVADKTVVIQVSEARRATGQRLPEAPKAAPPPQVQRADSPVTDVDRITVTGTRIRGGTTPSPVVTIGSENIREEGFTDLGQVIRSVSQNFSGGQNPGVGAGATASSTENANYGGGSALNLRGLGPGATLTLMNSRRLSYDGIGQAVDISAIPVEAVERIEIMPDGASAIYGSDAVGGVANVILKRDLEGVTVRARYGDSADGGLATREYIATAGTTWATGGVIATWITSSADPIFVSERDYTRTVTEPTTLYPGIDSSSGLVSVHQSVGDAIELRLDALRTKRDQTQYIDYSPYYPFYYYAIPTTTVEVLSPSLEASLPHDWTLTAGGTYAKDTYVYRTYQVSPTATSFRSHGCYCNESRSYEIGAEGPLFQMTGGDARMAVGAGSRTSEYLSESYLRDDGYQGKGRARYAYAELNLPFVSPALDIPGVHRLAVSAAVRTEDHDSFGHVTVPKLGLIYDPISALTFKASWGKSFKAPTLYQQFANSEAWLYTAGMTGGVGYPPDATVLLSYGSNPGLKPERARTWTTSLAFHPDSLPGLEAELTWFGIEYTDRVMQPIGVTRLALSNPSYAEFIEYAPTPERQAAFLAGFPTFDNYAGADYDPENVIAIVHNRFINVARQRVRGVDLSGSYRFDLGSGRMTVRGSSSWLDSEQRNSSGQPTQELAGTIFNPAKVRARAGAIWTQGGFSASGFANYTSGVTSRLIAGHTEKTASFVTVDAALRYDTAERESAWSGLSFELAVQNMLNRDPPLHTAASPLHIPFDSTNYSAIGRFVMVSVSKSW